MQEKHPQGLTGSEGAQLGGDHPGKVSCREDTYLCRTHRGHDMEPAWGRRGWWWGFSQQDCVHIRSSVLTWAPQDEDGHRKLCETWTS